MKNFSGFALAAILALAGRAGWADDITGAERLLCASVQATVCFEDGECATDVPQNLNIPDFIEVDLEARRLSTTVASGLNQSTPIAHLSREDGSIVLQGFEMGRAFSWVINEQTGRVSVAVAAGDRTVAVFGACTPLASATEPGR